MKARPQCRILAFALFLTGGCSTSPRQLARTMIGHPLNERITKAVDQVPEASVAGIAFEDNGLRDVRGQRLVVRDRALIDEALTALHNAEYTIVGQDLAIDGDGVYLLDEHGQNLVSVDVRWGIEVGPAWSRFIRHISATETQKVAVTSGQMKEVVRAVATRIVENGVSPEGIVYIPPPPPRITLTDPVLLARLNSLLGSGDSRLFAFIPSNKVPVKITLIDKAGGKQEVGVVLATVNLRGKDPDAFDDSLTPDRDGKRLLSALAPLVH